MFFQELRARGAPAAGLRRGRPGRARSALRPRDLRFLRRAALAAGAGLAAAGRGPRAAGRWSLAAPARAGRPADAAEFVARQLLRRTGVVFRRTLARESLPVPWRDIARACRALEARGEIRGGRFVAGFDGEQYALPEAVTLLRAVRASAATRAPPADVSAADPAQLPRHPHAGRARLVGHARAGPGRLGNRFLAVADAAC